MSTAARWSGLESFHAVVDVVMTILGFPRWMRWAIGEAGAAMTPIEMRGKWRMSTTSPLKRPQSERRKEGLGLGEEVGEDRAIRASPELNGQTLA
ncbi:hypothetical protein QJS04_geneDACA020430 [Acorus gramineus]|uniref:Uncharacterized protein n=1 Tax=Acorus gramineus TaxID=55184 RepID=A0AAV9BXQ3_ACOGR|nr:hypothetical protein QJS04_geneDACA020430 [Acorus gramineus]